MKYSQVDGETGYVERPHWLVDGVVSNVDEDTAIKRMQTILESLLGESWLPMGLRSMLVEEISEMQSQLQNRVLGMEEVSARVHAIALSSFSYEDLLSRSEAIAQLRILDLELNPNLNVRLD